MIEAVLIGGIAVWRLTYMLLEETGPAAIFEKLRARVDRLEWKDGGIRDGFNCFYCLSVWVALLFAALYIFIAPVFWGLSIFLALTALAIFTQEIFEKH